MLTFEELKNEIKTCPICDSSMAKSPTSQQLYTCNITRHLIIADGYVEFHPIMNIYFNDWQISFQPPKPGSTLNPLANLFLINKPVWYRFKIDGHEELLPLKNKQDVEALFNQCITLISYI